MRGQRNWELILSWLIDFQICVRIQEDMLEGKGYVCTHARPLTGLSSARKHVYSFFSFYSIQLRYAVM